MKRNSGFTLTELLVAVSIMGILAAIATPAFVKWLPGYRMNSAIRDLYSHLQQAKIKAIKTNTQYSVVFDQNVGGIDYAYIVFQDLNRDFTYNVGDGDPDDPDDPHMARWETGTFGTGIWVTGSGFKFDDNVAGTDGVGDGISFAGNAVGFRSNGIPVRSGGGDPSGGVFFVTDELGKTGSVSLSPAGSIRIQ